MALGSASVAGASCGGQASHAISNGTAGDGGTGGTSGTVGSASQGGATSSSNGAVITMGSMTNGATGELLDSSVSTTGISVAGAGGFAGAGCDYPLTSQSVECDTFDVPPLAQRVNARESEALCGCSLIDRAWSIDAYLVCLPEKPGVGCEEAYPVDCLEQQVSCGLFFDARRACGPLPANEGTCCWVLAGGCAVGRPFTVGGEARLAALVGQAVADPGIPRMQGLSSESRRALADAFSQDAQTEHASVASFARFALECLALGAPLELLQGAQQALADEIDHARICSELARTYGAEPFEFGPLDVAGALGGPVELARVAEGVARESCVAETVSALLLFEASRSATDAETRALLYAMGEDEVRHAALGFRFVKWALARGDADVRFRVRRAFADASRAVGFGSRTTLPADAAELRAHGYLPLEERQRIAATVIEAVVAPCAQELLRGDACRAKVEPALRG